VPQSAFLKAALAFTFALAIFASSRCAHAQTYSEATIYSFSGGAGGSEPLFSGLVRDKEGNFHGTTVSGGAYGHGTVFKVDASGGQTVLHSFGEGHDGRAPIGGVVLDEAGDLFGTTNGGGIQKGECSRGCGTVFEILANGDEKILHDFAGVQQRDGALPVGTFIRDAAGNLYGTTEVGGANDYGTIFKIDSAGNETVLYSFGSLPDAEYPEAGLIEDSSGNFYGTSGSGGQTGFGTVFEFDKSGNETVLHSFSSEPDGADPNTALLRDSQGNLYGTTFLGGSAGLGTVFKISAKGHETILHNFGTLGSTDGEYPESTLIRDGQGNLYGATIQGGTGGNGLEGIAFQITPQGAFNVLYDFSGQPGPATPAGPFLMDSNGDLYGASPSGGTTNNGSVFKLTPWTETMPK
jgi:uncharacterized repeat protein (TIGR03803 family)